MSHTYAILEVSEACHREIREKLEAAGYHHAFRDSPDGDIVDLQGLAIVAAKPRAPQQPVQLMRTGHSLTLETCSWPHASGRPCRRCARCGEMVPPHAYGSFCHGGVL